VVCGELGLPERHTSFDNYMLELSTLTADSLPLHVPAESDGVPIGVTTLKLKDVRTVLTDSSPLAQRSPRRPIIARVGRSERALHANRSFGAEAHHGAPLWGD
jgi:hypothetical protein